MVYALTRVRCLMPEFLTRNLALLIICGLLTEGTSTVPIPMPPLAASCPAMFSTQALALLPEAMPGRTAVVVEKLFSRRFFVKVGTLSTVLIGAPFAFGQEAPKGYTARMAEAVIGAMRSLTDEGLAPFKSPEFWEGKGLSEEEASAAALWSQWIIDGTRALARGLGAGELGDAAVATLIILRVEAQKLAEAIQAKPEDGLRSLLKVFPALLQIEFSLWAGLDTKPTDFMTAGELAKAIKDLPPSAAAVRDTLTTLLQELRPSEFKGFQDENAKQAIQRFRAAAMKAGFLVDVTILSFPDHLHSFNLKFDIYEADRTVPVEIEEVDGLRFSVIEFKALTQDLVDGQIVEIPGLEPFIAMMGSAFYASQADAYIEMRDTKVAAVGPYMPAGWMPLRFQRFLNVVFRGMDARLISRALRKATLTHELFHLWFRRMRHRFRNRHEHFGLSEDEWKEYGKKWALDSQEGPMRIPNELAAYIGELAFSDLPVRELQRDAEFITGNRTTVQTIVMDYLLRSVAGKLSGSLRGESRRLSSALARQHTPVTPEVARDWVYSLLDAKADVDELNRLIRDAARAVYAETYITEPGKTARLPEKLRTVAALRARDFLFLAVTAPTSLKTRRAAFLLFRSS